jgi:hypothetical protein
MGAAASVGSGESFKAQEVTLKKLPDAVEEAVYVHEKFPLVLDPTEQAGRFFKYQTGAYLNFEDPTQSTKAALNRALVASFLHGRTMTVKVPSLQGIQESVFEAGSFPIEVLDRSKFFLEEVWQSCLKPTDPPKDEASISSEFAFILCCTKLDHIPPFLWDKMHVIKVVDASDQNQDHNPDVQSSGDAGMDQIASMFGAAEIIRNSKDLVEAAFDGDLDEVKNQIQKGYHLESYDGRKHTALSEAACQGHLHVVQWLLENGADPNAVNDTGRSALWRAAFNNHVEIVNLMLQSGADPQARDKVSMESAFDVSTNEEIRAILVSVFDSLLLVLWAYSCNNTFFLPSE